MSSKDPLTGTRWKLEGMNSTIPLTDAVITLEFADQRLSGSSGCNGYGAEYKISGENIQIEAIAMTEIACLDENIMQLESDYSNFLGQVKNFKISENRLELFDDTGAGILVFTNQ